jgi:hypothetical protein
MGGERRGDGRGGERWGGEERREEKRHKDTDTKGGHEMTEGATSDMYI